MGCAWPGGNVTQESRRKIRDLEVLVSDAMAETPDTTTLVLFSGAERLEYRPGHFCTIAPQQFKALERFTEFLEDLKGKREPPRAYSLTSAPHERYLAITIKEERFVKGVTRYPPLLSPLLVRNIQPGARMIITGFTGPYTLPDDVESRTDHLVHLVAGSGAVPNFSILKHCLHQRLKLRHTFIYSNKTWDDICFRKELEALQWQYPERLRLVHALTRESGPALSAPGVHRGRISLSLLAQHIPDPESCLVYACGPAISAWDRLAAKEKGVTPAPRFLEGALELLDKLGVARSRIKYESYG